MSRGRALALALVAIAAVAVVVLHGRGITAAREPSAIESRLARAAWLFLMPASAKESRNPLPPDASLSTELVEHWADHCAICHGSDGGGATEVSRHMFPPAPDMRTRWVQDLTDGELFYAIEEGVPFTGMPAWSTHSEDGTQDSWALVQFIRRVPTLTPDDVARVEAAMPKSAADLAREKEIEDFLTPAPSK